MKRVALLIAGISLVACLAEANIYVQWEAGWGFYDGPGGEGTASPALSVNDVVLIQLLYSYDNVIGACNAAFSGTGYLDTSGNDAVLDWFSYTYNGGNDPWQYSDSAYFTANHSTNVASTPASANPYNDGGTYTNSSSGTGYIFGRVINMGSDGVAQAGEAYFTTVAFDADDINPAQAPNEFFDFNDDTQQGSVTEDDWLDQTVVPEPGTMILFAIGLSVLGLRRKIKK